MSRNMSQHTEWLSMIEVSGPFLAVSVLEKIFPQGLESLETCRKKRIRSAYEEWRDAVEEDDPQLPELHRAWIGLVLEELLEYEDSVLEAASDEISYKSPDGDGQFKPDFVLKGDGGSAPMLFVSLMPEGTDLEKVKVGDGWPVPVFERMTLLCRDKGVRLGLVTNGERWMLVNAPVGSTSSHVSWYARLWFQEPVTLMAFQSLLGVRRWFGSEDETLPAILEDSLSHHEEVTDTLGEQVKRAVEVLIQCLDKADQDRNRELLHDVLPAVLYEAGLTVMMRLVFVLCAEERGLLLLNDPVYDRHYAITTLRGQLAEEADQHGHEVLERRHDAWTRLLAVFRAVYGGIEHESLRMPALGGSLFDPDRFPFLEGRAKGTHWQETPAQPLPIDNRTVLLLLEALQVLEQRGGALLLSYKALDVEQIGHVYEGLLEHTVRRLKKDTLGLIGSQKAKNPNIALAELESAQLDGLDTLAKLVKETTLRSLPAIKKALQKEVDDATFGKIVTVCGGDMALAARLKPFVHLLRSDAWGDFIVYRAHSFAVTLGADRRETGTHYTPKSLTESIVETTLEPVAYVGPAEGKPRDEWQLKSSAELLDLKICDPAMGSGAFLVQVCRWLSERLVEAWGKETVQGKFITVDGVSLESAGSAEPMPDSLDERLLIARRLVAEKCLYGVDLNPLAVELAKLSIWLITLAKSRPFGFLDHNLRSGDSLLGLHKLEQLTKFSLHPEKKPIISIFASNIEAAVTDALTLRKQLRETPIRDIRDVQYMERLDQEARQKLEHIEHIADAMIGEVLVADGNSKKIDNALDNISIWASEYCSQSNPTSIKVINDARRFLLENIPNKPFHWALEFPEVFERGGFDAIVGNPPFIPITGIEWLVRRYIESQYVCAVGRHNTFSSFAERALSITHSNANIGLVVPDRMFLNVQYEPIRTLLFGSLSFSKIIDFSGAFKATVDTIAIIGHKKRLVDSIHVFRHSKDGQGKPYIEEKEFNQTALRIAFDGAINIYVEPEDANIYSLVKGQSVPLGEIADTKDGIIQGAVADLLFMTEQKDDCSHKLLFGVDVHRYEIEWSNNWVNYKPDELMQIEIERRGPKKRPGLWMRNSAIFEKPKIVTRQTSDRIIAAIDNNNFYYANTLHGTSLSEEAINSGYSLEFLVALMNSKLLNYIYAVITGEVGKVFAQIKIDTLKKVPMHKDPCNDISKEITALVGQFNSGKIDCPSMIRKIDELVFELYQLDSKSVRYVEDRFEKLYGEGQ